MRAKGGREKRGTLAELGPCEGYRRNGVAFADLDDGGGGGGFEVRGAGGGGGWGGGVEDVFREVEAGAGEPLGEGGHGGFGVDDLGGGLVCGDWVGEGWALR